MKTATYVIAILTTLSLLSGCAENKTRIGEGAGIGALLGAGAGAIIGHQSGHGMEGALIGGAVGATGGAVAGSQMEKETTTTETK